MLSTRRCAVGRDRRVAALGRDILGRRDLGFDVAWAARCSQESGRAWIVGRWAGWPRTRMLAAPGMLAARLAPLGGLEGL